jgi:hypothetical protein
VSHLLRALETFSALGIAFVSLTEQMDTTTPTGEMAFTVLGAAAELERSLIADSVGLRAHGLAWRAIASQLGVACYIASRVCTPFQKSGKGFWNAIDSSSAWGRAL